MLNKEMQIHNMMKALRDAASKYENSNFKDINLLYMYSSDDIGMIRITKCISEEDRARAIQNFDDFNKLNFLSSVKVKEFIVGITTSISCLNKYAEEIDIIFNKRLYAIDDELIKSFLRYGRYMQLGYDVSSSIKLALCMLHDMEKNEAIKVERVLNMYMDGITSGVINLKGIINPCGSDIVKLLKRMNSDINRGKNEWNKFTFTLDDCVVQALYDLAASCYTYIDDGCLANIFSYKDEGAMCELVGLKDVVELKEKSKTYFNNTDFRSLKDPRDSFEYFINSSHFAKRILRNTGLEKGSFSEESFLAGVSILPYAPDGFNRSDTQFITYLVLNHLYTNLNKTLRRYETEEEYQDAKERLYMSYMLSKRFGYEKKELHNMAILFNSFFEISKDLESTIQSNLENIISNILHLKNFESSKIATMNEMFLENKELKKEISELMSNMEKYENEAEKKAYTKARKAIEEEMKLYKKEISVVNKELKELKKSKKEDTSEIATTKVDEDESYTKKETINLSTMSAVFVGDENFDESLLDRVFSEVVKVNGSVVSKRHVPDKLMEKHDILIYQSKYMQHVSAAFIRAANNFGKKIIYVDTCNAGLVLSEVYKEMYS